MLMRCTVVFFLLLGVSAAPAATVQTVDDATVNGTLTSFDGSVLTVTVSDKGQLHPTTMPLEDIARIAIRETSTRYLPPVAVQPAPVDTSITDSNGGQPNPPVRMIRRTPRRFSATAPTAEPTVIAAPVPTTLPAAVSTTVPSATTTLATTSAPSIPPATLPATAPATAPAPQQVVSPNWRMKLVDGDALHGGLLSWADQQLAIRPDAAPASDIALALDAVDWLWHGDASQQAKAEAMQVPRGADDVAFVRKEKGGEIVAVHGTAIGINGDSLGFRNEGEDRKISLARLVGVVFAERTPKPNTAFHQTIRLVDGEQLSGHWKSLEGDTISMQTDTGVAVRFPLASVAGIDFRNGRLTYVSDLTPAKVEQTPYFDRLIPYRTDVSLAGGPLKLSDGTYAKGLAVHSRCVLEYDLGGQFERFKTKLGFEPGAGAMGRCAVRVLADGKPLFENADAKGEDKPVAIDVALSNVSRLTLEVDFGQGQDVGGRVIWADARLLRAKVGGE